MIKKIFMYNVGNADCFLCTDKSKLLSGKYNCFLVDCGGKSNNKLSTDLTNKLIKSSKNDLLISHYHSDHYNRLDIVNQIMKKQGIIKPFKTIYIPNFLGNFGFEMLILGLIYIKNAKIISAINNILQIINLWSYTNLWDPNTKIYLVSKGCFDTNNVCTIRVLAPFDGLNASSLIPLDSITRAKIKEIKDEYMNLLEIDPRNIESNKIGIKIPEDFIEKFEHLKEKINEIKRNTEISSKEIKENFNKYFDSLSIIFDQIGYYEFYYNTLMGFNEKFQQNDLCSKEMPMIYDFTSSMHNVLFFGDATKSTIETLNMQNDYSDNYVTIKVSHHGTKTHFTDQLPNSKYLLIPGSKKNKEQIYCQYSCKYPGRIFVCSNNQECMVRNNGCTCQSNKTSSVCGIQQSTTNKIYKEINI